MTTMRLDLLSIYNSSSILQINAFIKVRHYKYHYKQPIERIKNLNNSIPHNYSHATLPGVKLTISGQTFAGQALSLLIEQEKS